MGDKRRGLTDVSCHLQNPGVTGPYAGPPEREDWNSALPETGPGQTRTKPEFKPETRQNRAII